MVLCRQVRMQADAASAEWRQGNVDDSTIFPMSALPFAIPDHVVDWISDIFEQVNQRSASTLSRIPTTWETTLDHSLIGHLAEFSAPFRFPSNWVVNLDTHFLGGGRYWGKWEIADIGLLIVFRRSGHVISTELALLQSKRLYPKEVDVELAVPSESISNDLLKS